MVIKAFDIQKVEDFQKGIVTRDLDKVRGALDAGVDAATPVNGKHPLEVLLYSAYKMSPGLPYEQYLSRGSELVDLLLEKGAKLVQEEKYESNACAYLADRLLASNRTKDVSTVVLHAIKESFKEYGELYTMDIGSFVSNYIHWRGVPKQDLLGTVTEALNMMESIHDLVRARLTVPTTKLEQDIVRKYHPELGYWIHRFERPDLDAVMEALQTQEQESKFDQMVKVLPKKTPQQVLKEFDALVGLDGVKRGARALYLRAQFDQARAAEGLPVTPQALHTVFAGNPGTGKTTVARLYAELLYSLGLGGNKYLEISRENMVGQYIGQTEKNMVDLLDSADTVFIDEAYNLVGEKGDKKDYGNRIIDALIPALENRRDELTLFFAGYTEEMRNMISSNPGLQSRVTRYEHLEDYSTDDLGNILDMMLKSSGLSISANAREDALKRLEEAKTTMPPREFGNARIVRTLVEQLPNQMAERLLDTGAPVKLSADDLSVVTKADITAFFENQKLGVGQKAPASYTPVGFRPSYMNGNG